MHKTYDPGYSDIFSIHVSLAIITIFCSKLIISIFLFIYFFVGGGGQKNILRRYVDFCGFLVCGVVSSKLDSFKSFLKSSVLRVLRFFQLQT